MVLKSFIFSKFVRPTSTFTQTMYLHSDPIFIVDVTRLKIYTVVPIKLISIKGVGGQVLKMQYYPVSFSVISNLMSIVTPVGRRPLR